MTAAGKVRIIGGKWRRSLLPVPAVPGLRPSPDRVRETLFNWLGQDCSGLEVLDLFAGTGALGFEAASRGASKVVLVENHPALVKGLRANAEMLLQRGGGASGEGLAMSPSASTVISVIGQDAHASIATLSRTGQRFDLVMMDPPFGTEALSRCLPLACGLVKPGGMVYCEWGEQLTEAALQAIKAPVLEPYRHLKAGQVHAHLFSLVGL